MKILIFTCIFFVLSLFLYSWLYGEKIVGLRWDRNREKDLVGYRLYYRPCESEERWKVAYEGPENSVVVTVPDDGDFVCRAFDRSRQESRNSNINAGCKEPPSSLPGDEGGGSDSGCFMAFIIHSDHNKKVLREFRDRYLLTNFIGQYLVSCYYIYSPYIVELFV